MARLGVALFCAVLCWVSSAEGRHECDRLCLENEPPKECFYQFTIRLAQRHGQNATRTPVLSVNGQSPGPVISVCHNDLIVVDVKNQLPSGLETAIHWHGLLEGNSPFVDGVPMVTQCPILPRTSFRYRLIAYKTGTFFYRAHSVAQQLDGVHGPLIVHPQGYRAHPEKVIFLSPLMKVPQVLEGGYQQDLNVTALRLDVYSLSEGVQDHAAERLRVINAAALDCPVTLFTHTVPLKVVAVDGSNVRPAGLDEVVINPGERVDLLVKSEVMKTTHIVGHNLCKGHDKYGFDPGITENHDKSDDVATNKDLNVIGMIQKLESEKPENLQKADLRILLSFDSSVYNDFQGAVDFRYKLGGLTPYAPSVLTEKTVSLLQFHNKSFLYPPSPLMSQPEDLQEDMVCPSDDISARCRAFDNGFCECLQMVDFPYNYNLDLFLIDEGKHGNTSQTVYIHGHSFFVLSMKTFEKPISAVELWKKEVLGEIHRNLVNPIRKDTIVVPNKGYVALRVRPTNPGKWLLESSTSKAKTGFGLEVIMNVEDPASDVVPPEGFPKCGNMKEPDLVFTDD